MVKTIRAIDVQRDLTQLYLYIKEALKRGQNRYDIKQDLISNGWLDTEVDKVFIRIDTEKLSDLARELENQLGKSESGSPDAYVVREMVQRERSKKETPKKVKKKVTSPKKKKISKKRKPKVVVKKEKPKKKYGHRFVASKDGGMYHTYNCHWGDSIELKKQRFFKTKEAAHKKGYKACAECIK